MKKYDFSWILPAKKMYALNVFDGDRIHKKWGDFLHTKVMIYHEGSWLKKENSRFLTTLQSYDQKAMNNQKSRANFALLSR